MPVIFEFINCEFVDKLTYVMLECICYYMITVNKQKVSVNFINMKHTINTYGITSSPLIRLYDKNSAERFKTKFKSDLSKLHFRRVVKNDSMAPTNIMTEVHTFLKCFDVAASTRNNITEVVAELVGNTFEHTDGDCLIDLDITNPNYKIEGKDDIYYGVNLVVINFSHCLLGDSIKEKMQNESILNERHKKLKKAYAKHKNYFDNNYNEKDFYNIASFQHHISGRPNLEMTGGTGLTILVNQLENASDYHDCYVMTGDRVLYFKENLIRRNKDMWIGFNKENDFLEKPPAMETIEPGVIFMPGTAYNLIFVMKKEK